MTTVCMRDNFQAARSAEIYCINPEYPQHSTYVYKDFVNWHSFGSDWAEEIDGVPGIYLL